MSSSIYHYTHRTQLADILRTGAIEARTRSHWLNPHGIPPLAWCSSAALWEPVCSATLVIGPDAVLPINTVPGRAYEAARVRISPEAAEAWDIAMAKSGAHWSTIMRLAQTGYEQNSDPRRWLASRRPILARMWIGVDLWDGECWVRVPRQNEQYCAADLDAFAAGVSVVHSLPFSDLAT